MCRSLLLISAALAPLAGCTLQQVYATGQQSTRQQCLQLPDREDRTRCEKNADLSYDKYRAEAEAARKPSQ